MSFSFRSSPSLPNGRDGLLKGDTPHPTPPRRPPSRAFPPRTFRPPGFVLEQIPSPFKFPGIDIFSRGGRTPPLLDRSFPRTPPTLAQARPADKPPILRHFQSCRRFFVPLRTYLMPFSESSPYPLRLQRCASPGLPLHSTTPVCRQPFPRGSVAFFPPPCRNRSPNEIEPTSCSVDRAFPPTFCLYRLAISSPSLGQYEHSP